MRPVNKKIYQDHTFALRIPLELDDDDLCSPQDGTPFLIVLACICLTKTHISSSILNMGEPHLAHLHISITIKYMASFKNIESSIWPSWTCTLPWSILNLFFALHNDNVLKITVMTHSTFSFFKTFFTGDSGVYTPDTPATLGSTLTRPFFGSSLNITLVNTWFSFLYSPFHHETNIWSTSIAYGQILQV